MRNIFVWGFFLVIVGGRGSVNREGSDEEVNKSKWFEKETQKVDHIFRNWKNSFEIKAKIS